MALLVCVILNLNRQWQCPQQLTAFLFGCLVCIGVGYSVVSTHSSPVLLTQTDESRVRRRQYVVGLLLSLLLALAFLIPELREAPSSWLLVPVILLTPALLLRELIARILSDPASVSEQERLGLKYKDTYEDEQH